MGEAAWTIYKLFGLPGAGLIFLLEGLGAPIPVEIPLGIIGLRVAHGLSTYWEMVFLVWITTVIGNTAGYVVGYYGGRPLALRMLSWFRVKQEVWNKVDDWFKRHGIKVVVATRWINWGFAQNMWLCGITRVPFARFMAVMGINDFLWAMGWTWVAEAAVLYFRRRSTRFLHMSALKVGGTALLMIALVVVIWLAVRWWRNRRQLARN